MKHTVPCSSENLPYMHLCVSLGWISVVLSAFLLIPSSVSYFLNESMVKHFLVSAFITGAWGVLMLLVFDQKKDTRLQTREGFLITFMSWVAVSLFSALPFYLSKTTLSFLDSLFESVSALTTTGISFLEESRYNHDEFSEGLRLWRILLQWIGGLGIMLMALIVLPFLKTDGGLLLASEFSDRSEKMVPRSSEVAWYLFSVYAGFTAMGTLFLWCGELSFLQSLYMSISSISTGGIVPFSLGLDDLSFYTKSIVCFLMVIGGSTLVLLIGFLKGSPEKYFSDDQTQGYYKILFGAFMIMFFFHSTHKSIDSLFIVISSLTTTGFFSHNNFSSFVILCAFLLSFIGGCSGSTTGGIKIFRLQIMYRLARTHMKKVLQPSDFFMTAYDKVRVGEKAAYAVISVIFLYMATWFLFALFYAAHGKSVCDAIILSGNLITNCGFLSDDMVASLQHTSLLMKSVMIIEMLCGRFECVSLIALLMR